MTQCPQCGAPTHPGQAFCGTCGASLAPGASEQTVTRPATPQPTMQFPVTPQQPPAQQQWGPPPPPHQQGWAPQGPPPQGPPPQGPPPQGPPPGYPQPGPSIAGFDLSRVLVGNWLGAGLAALAAFGVALVLGLVVAFAGADDLDASSAIWTALILTANTFGVDTLIEARSEDGSIGQYPLLATFVALGLAAYLFRRAMAGTARIADGVLDAARAGLILSALVFLLAIVTKIATPTLEGYSVGGEGPPASTFALILPNGEATVSVAGAIFLPFLLLFVVLAATCLTRRDWLGDRLAVVHRWAAAPLAGIAALVLGLLGAGLLWTIAQVIGTEDDRGLAQLVGVLAVLPAAGLHLVGLGSLSAFGTKVSTDGEDPDPMWDRLWDVADDSGAMFWIAPLAAIGVAAFAIWAVLRKSEKADALRNLGVYLGSLVLVVPLLVRLANIHYGSEDYSFTGGSEGFQTMLLFTLLSAIVGVGFLVLTGSIDVNAVKAKAAALQSQPGQQQWGQQQWGQQPQQPWGPPPPYGQQPPWDPPPQGPPPQGPPPQSPPPQSPPPQSPPPQSPPPPYGQQPPWGPPPQGPPPQGPPPQGPPPQGPPQRD